jgi:UDP-N-acetylglucosamine--N-acetylmuramyl-(pentapeptide) pyrophosphoryl-undecaprenol N-acetylglucosamine transferase
MRLLISGGGTGGHLFPALAVARAFRAERPGDQVLIVGRRGGPEERLVPEAGFPLETVSMRGLDRDAVWKNIALPVLLPRALFRGIGIVDRFRPDVALGVGGYAMAPAVAAARVRQVPYVLHEQNVRPGLATRLFAGGAAAVCATFPGTEARLRRTRRVVLTGLPLREGFEPAKPRVPPRRLLVTGGSQGARRLNRATWEALDGLLERFEEVVHVTGQQGAEELERYRRPGYSPLTFTTEMPSLMREADLVVSRAGVGTLAELTAVGLPAILVPGTFGGGHQEENAEALVQAGAAVRIPDDELTGRRLLDEIAGLDDAHLSAMAAAARSLGRRDAAEQVLRILEEVARV